MPGRPGRPLASAVSGTSSPGSAKAREQGPSPSTPALLASSYPPLRVHLGWPDLLRQDLRDPAPVPAALCSKACIPVSHRCHSHHTAPCPAESSLGPAQRTPSLDPGGKAAPCAALNSSLGAGGQKPPRGPPHPLPRGAFLEPAQPLQPEGSSHPPPARAQTLFQDRKSTRLNSSHT